MSETTSKMTARDTTSKGESSGIGDTMAAARDALRGMPAAIGQAGSEAAGSTLGAMQQLRTKLEDAAQGMTGAPLTTRLAWRAGRWLGRVEGVLWLSSKGIGMWWSRTQKRLASQPGSQWMRTAAQWAPSILALTWMAAQLINRARRSGAGEN